MKIIAGFVLLISWIFNIVYLKIYNPIYAFFNGFIIGYCSSILIYDGLRDNIE